MGSFVCSCGQRSSEVRSGCKMGQNVKFISFEKLKSKWNQTWFIDIQYGTLCMFVPSEVIYQGQRPSERGQVVRWAQNVKFPSFEKLEVWLEPNLVYWYNVGTFTCIWGQRSQIKVKCHVRSISKIAWKCTIWPIWGPVRTMWPQKVWDQGRVSICIMYKLLWQATLAIRGPRCMFFSNKYDKH